MDIPGYDANGNIAAMNQIGLKPNGTSAYIDQLSYQYKTGSNQLAMVGDDVMYNAADKSGDFQNVGITGDDC